MPFNHNINLADYIAGLEYELAQTADKAHKAAILAELESVRGGTAVVAPAETRTTAPAATPAPAKAEESVTDFGGE